MIELTDQQQRDLKNNGDPLRVHDPSTNTDYVLLRADIYARFRQIVDAGGKESMPASSDPGTCLTNDVLSELVKKHKPPQSWYDEDMAGLY